MLANFRPEVDERRMRTCTASRDAPIPLTNASAVLSTTSSSSLPVRAPGSPINKLNNMVATCSMHCGAPHGWAAAGISPGQSEALPVGHTTRRTCAVQAAPSQADHAAARQAQCEVLEHASASVGCSPAHAADPTLPQTTSRWRTPCPHVLSHSDQAVVAQTQPELS